jgi:hypothetical protein
MKKTENFIKKRAIQATSFVIILQRRKTSFHFFEKDEYRHE